MITTRSLKDYKNLQKQQSYFYKVQLKVGYIKQAIVILPVTFE